MSPVTPIYTIGYGNRSADELVAVLQQHNIAFLVDVRSAPYSRHRPEYNKEALEQKINGSGLRYLFLGHLLGGRPEDPSCYDAQGNVDYAAIRSAAWFAKGIGRIEKAFKQQLRVALLCSEAKPEACHRSTLIGESLVQRDIPVEHIDENGDLVLHADVMQRVGTEQLALFAPKPATAASAGGTIRETLKRVFGYDRFRPNQQPIITNILAKRDTLVIMPTGGGKSLCYQLPALHFDGLTVVVSPLISLMQDQVTQLEALGVAATFLNSTLTQRDYFERMNRIRSGRVKLLYVAPESLLQDGILNLLGDANLSCLTIDEAHCISSWGHDFRPEYRRLVEVRQQFPQAVCVALTATATPRVREDIQQSLNFEQGNQFVSSFDRPNLRIDVRPRDSVVAQVVDFVADHHGQSGIVYCGTRRRVEEIAAALSERGVNCLPYHAGMDSQTRAVNQNAFIRDDVPIIVATIAFGMGINKPNVRWVLHADLPKNIESYYQEIGRAGRDGLPSDCLLLFNYQDVAMQRHFIQQGSANEYEGRDARLQALVTWAQSGKCRRIGLLGYFGETFADEQCGNCDNCLREPVDGEDITELAQKFISAVVRVQQKFGMMHVINVLRGSLAQGIIKWGHERLSVHGIGKDVSTKEWKHLARQFIALDLVAQDGRFPSLKVTPAGHAVLKGEQVLGTRLRDEKAAKPAKSADLAYNTALFELLRRKRKQLADDGGVPPYVIFSDQSLAEMATYFPHSEASFGRISGVGEKKLAQYADHFLPIIRDFCQAQNLIEHPELTQRRETVRKERGLSSRSQLVADAFRSGATLELLQSEYGVKRQTVLNHLANVVKAGETLPVKRVQALSTLAVDDQLVVLAAFAELGDEFLKPLFERFGGKIDYDELRLMQIVYRLGAGERGSAEINPNQLEEKLFERLVQLTARLAQAEGVPPFMLFGNSTLRAIVTHMPRTVADFATIDGVGRRHVQQYGQIFVDHIAAFAQKHAPES